MNNTEALREQFEDWAIEQPRVAAEDDCFSLDSRSDRYASGLVQSLWLAWQAALASTPAQPVAMTDEDPLHRHIQDALESAPDMLLSYVEAIKASGDYDRWHYIPEVEDVAGLIRGYAAPQPATSEQRKPLIGEWQPIETAPKDGSLFLCWVLAVRYGETDEGQQYQEDVSEADFCHWQSHDDAPDGGWFEPCCGQIGDAQYVTHWMPLPDAPGGIRSTGGEHE